MINKQKLIPALTAAGLLTVGLLCCAADVSKGQAAPDFKLQGTDGKTYTLSQFKGKKAVVIAWFPKAFTKGCTIECKSLHDSAQAIQGYDVAYFAASVDDLETNKKFATSLELPFPILADPTKSTGQAYGVVGPQPVAKRWTYYIDKQGNVLEVDKAINPAQAGDDLKKHLDALGIPKVK